MWCVCVLLHMCFIHIGICLLRLSECRTCACVRRMRSSGSSWRIRTGRWSGPGRRCSTTAPQPRPANPSWRPTSIAALQARTVRVLWALCSVSTPLAKHLTSEVQCMERANQWQSAKWSLPWKQHSNLMILKCQIHVKEGSWVVLQKY